MSNDVRDFLMGGTGKGFKFENVTDTVSGVVTNVEIAQQTSMEDNTPLTWADGSPRMQLIVSLQTDLRDPESENDDGVRRIFAKGGNFEVATGSGKSMKEAIADAVRRAGAKSIDEGGTLTVAYTGEGKKTNRGYQAPKLFKAKYEPPVNRVAADDLFD